MNGLPDISILTNTFGLLFAMSSMAIVATAARPLVGTVRRGMVFMLWGLTSIVFSFIAVLFGFGGDAQMVLLSLGMVMILVASHQLFSLYRSDNF